MGETVSARVKCKGRRPKHWSHDDDDNRHNRIDGEGFAFKHSHEGYIARLKFNAKRQCKTSLQLKLNIITIVYFLLRSII